MLDKDSETCCVTVYAEEDQEGASKEFCGNKSSLGDNWKDRISSFVVNEGCEVKVFQNANYKGKSREFEGTVSNLEEKCMDWDNPWFGNPSTRYCDKNWNNKISSLKVYKSE